MKIKRRIVAAFIGVVMTLFTFNVNAVDLYCSAIGCPNASVNCGNSAWCGVAYDAATGISTITCANGEVHLIACINPE